MREILLKGHTISLGKVAVIPVGKPVVATRMGSIPEPVDHDQAGLLVPPCDSDALAEAVVSLSQD